MRLITLQCPACGADLNVEEGRNTYYCSYCQHKIMLDDEAQHVKVSFENVRESGYEFERGRISAQSEGADKELIEEVGKLAATLPKLERLHANNVNAQKRLEGLKRKKSQLEGGFSKHLNVIVSAACILLAMACASEGASAGVVLVFIAAAIGAFLFIKLNQEIDVAQTGKQIENMNSIIEKNKKEMKDLEDTCNLGAVPNSYLNSYAVNYIYDALRNKRAINISQAINQFEEYCYRNRMESMQKEQLESQRRMEEQSRRNGNNRNGNSRNSMGQSVATGVGMGIGSALVKEAFRQIRKF